MNYSEYEKLLIKMPCTLSLEYHQAVMWLHPETLPLGVVSIGDAVGAVRIPSRARNAYGRMVPVITFRRGTFQWNDKVTDIVLPPTINEIKTGAFVGCTDLRRITIPKQVKKIGEDTFKGCDRLEDVYFEGSREDWEKILIVHQKREIEFGKLIPGSPVQAITSERLLHIPGNDALFTANLHFHCALPDDCEDTRTFREPKSKQQYELLDLARRCKSTRKAKLINLVCYYAEGLAAGREYELVLPEEKSGNPRFDKVICHMFVSDPLVSDVSCRFFFFLQGMYGTVENTLFSTNCSEPYDFGKENVTLADVQAEIAAIEKQIGGKVGYATAMSDQLKLKYLHKIAAAFESSTVLGLPVRDFVRLNGDKTLAQVLGVRPEQFAEFDLEEVGLRLETYNRLRRYPESPIYQPIGMRPTADKLLELPISVLWESCVIMQRHFIEIVTITQNWLRNMGEYSEY